MGRRLWWVAAAALLAGCANAPVAAPPVDELQLLRERAEVVLANYDKAVGDAGLVVLPGGETAVAGTLEPRNEQLKTAGGSPWG
ncbi:hypothetical protein M1L60_40095 [Actinoplanes sp. TRM 88003]|uniref:Uncharacterized protein n=1 Tax=Paractinoplanes aksuensis TaxID=2939490 RepID=A0ABT1E0X6_9ACTN|nr:hypothetical protein [Actinoplanes aksuensis]MCO8276800.1 hypothetical protein [Actinoplanes aksuensis]